MEITKHIQQITTTMRVDCKHDSQQAHKVRRYGIVNGREVILGQLTAKDMVVARLLRILTYRTEGDDFLSMCTVGSYVGNKS